MEELTRRATSTGIRFPTWAEYAEANLVLPCLVQAALTVVFNILSVFYGQCYNKRGRLHTLVHTYIGTQENMRVSRPVYIVTCYILQLGLSLLTVALFAVRTYTRSVSYRDHCLDLVMSSFFGLHYFFLRMQAGFSPSSAWSLNALIDVLTVVPVLFPVVVGRGLAPDHVRWLAPTYLRSYRALVAYQRLERTVGLGEVSEFYRRIFLSILRTAALVICLGCTVYTLEILGELPGWEDQFVTTGMGDLSFVQMTYWMFTTISTVGYGDYSPTTAPSRIFVVGCILAGVAFWGREIDEIIALRSLLHHHRGRYVPGDPDRAHVVVVGPGVARFSPTMEALLKEILEAGSQAPDIVLLSEDPFEDELLQFARKELPPKVRLHVHFLVGSAMAPGDLARARLKQCAMAFIVPDMVAPASTCDGQNILRAIEMKRYRPTLELRLMLLQPESKQRALNIGIGCGNCFSAFEQKIDLLAQSTRVRGFLPLVVGLLQEVTLVHLAQPSRQTPEGAPEWMVEYLTSLQNTACGFLVGPKLAGLSFKAAAAKVYEETAGRVVLIAVQDRGKLVLSFQGMLSSGQVAIAIAPSADTCGDFADTTSDWRLAFLSNRDDSSWGGMLAMPDTDQDEDMQADELPAPRSERSINRPRSRASTESTRHFQRVTSDSNFGDDEGLMDQVTRSQQARDARELLSDPALVTLIVLGASTWPQVVAFIRTLRQPYLPGQQPVVVLSATLPPASVVEMFESKKTVFLVGPVLRVHNLREAGVQQAQTTVVLSGEHHEETAPGAPPVLMDHNAVLLASTVEKLLGGSNVRHFAVYQFATTKAVDLVQYVSSGMSKVRPSLQDQKSTLPQVQSLQSLQDAASFTRQAKKRWRRMKRPFWRVAQILRNVCEDLFSNTDLADRDLEEAEDGPAGCSQASGKMFLQPRFASGQTLTMDFFGSSFGHVYHFPPTLDLMHALTMPKRWGQQSFPWQVRCPAEWVGHPFGHLLKAWLLCQDPKLEDVGSVLVIALYRQPTDKSAGARGWEPAAGYNVTLPSSTTSLRHSDLVTVLAAEAFGHAMAQRGLLCGAGAQGHGAPELPGSEVGGEPTSSSVPASLRSKVLEGTCSDDRAVSFAA